MDEKIFKSKLKELVKDAKKKNSVLESEEVRSFFDDNDISDEELEKCYKYLEKKGIDILVIDNINEIDDIDEDKILISTEDEEVESEKIDETDIAVLEGISTEDPVRMYLKEIGKVSLLSMEDEVELAKRMSEGDDISRKRLTESNLRLVVSIAKRYSRRQYGIDKGCREV